MKVRIYFPFAPVPVSEGAYLVVADQIRHFLACGHEVEFVCWRESPETFAEKRAQSGSIAAAKWLLLHGGRESYWDRIRRVGLSTFSQFASPELFHYPPALLEQLCCLGPADLAVYHYSFAFCWLSRKTRLPWESKRVVHVHNVESELHGMRGGRLAFVHRRNARKLRMHERALASLVDEVWFLSPVDSEKMDFGNKARAVPPTFDPGLRLRRRASGTSEIVIGFIGGMDFRPNLESVRWILRELAPRLASGSFKGKLLLAGRRPPPEVVRLGAKYPFVEIPGFVRDLDQFWAALSFLVAPHVIGTGVRTKILEAMASGVPVLTNRAGAASLPAAARSSSFLFCRNDPDEWARILLGEFAPFRTRSALEREPTCRSLLAEFVYSDVA